MKEITVIVDAQITNVFGVSDDTTEMEELLKDPVYWRGVEKAIKEVLKVDDVNLKNSKLFIRDEKEAENV